MNYIVGIVMLISLLVAVLMEIPVIGYRLDNITVAQETDTESPMDGEANSARRTATTSCGRTPGFLSGRKSFQNDEHSDSDDNSDLNKILGGNYVTYGEAPWYANFAKRSNPFRPLEPFCGGALLNKIWVVTSAECVIDLDASTPGTTWIILGDHTLGRVDAGQIFVQYYEKFIHTEYRRGGYDYNIAMIKFKDPIKYNNNVQPVCLASSGDTLPVHTRLTYAGWGRTEYRGSRPQVLKKTTLPVINCSETYIYHNTRRMVCAGQVFGVTDLCPGDSGGPAVYNSRGTYILYGIGYYGGNCERWNHPVMLASVPAYRGWMIETIQNHSKSFEAEMPRMLTASARLHRVRMFR